MPEADDDRMAEVPDAVGIRAQVDVVGAVGDRRDRREGGVDLHERDGAVRVGLLGERRREGLCPAAVVADEVRLLARPPWRSFATGS